MLKITIFAFAEIVVGAVLVSSYLQAALAVHGMHRALRTDCVLYIEGTVCRACSM